MTYRDKPSQTLAPAGSILSGLLRLLQLPANFTPIGGLSLYSGARIRGWQAFVIPLAILLVTDIALHFTKGYPIVRFDMLFVYGAFVINILLGRKFLSRTESPVKILSIAAVGSLQFFIVTNFAAFLSLNYPKTIEGLIQCYAAGIPFYGWTFAGDMLFSGLLFGAHHLLAQRYFQAETVSAQ